MNILKWLANDIKRVLKDERGFWSALIPAAISAAGSLLGSGSSNQPSYQNYLPQEYYDLLAGLQGYVLPNIGQPYPTYPGSFEELQPSMYGYLDTLLTNYMNQPVTAFPGLYGMGTTAGGTSPYMPTTTIPTSDKELQALYDSQMADLEAEQAKQMKFLESQYGASGLSTSGAYLGPQGALPELQSTQLRDIGSVMSNYNLSQTQAQMDAAYKQQQAEQSAINLAYNDYIRMLEQPLQGVSYGLQLGQAQAPFTSMPYTDWTRSQEGTQQNLQNAMNLMNILSGQASSQYQSDLSNYQNKQSGQSSFWSGLGQLGTSLGSLWPSTTSSGGTGFSTKLTGTDLWPYMSGSSGSFGGMPVWNTGKTNTGNTGYGTNDYNWLSKM